MIDFTDYLDQATESTSSAVKRWVGESRLRSALEEEFRQTIAGRMESEEQAIGYAQLCPVEGAVPADYHLREIEIADDLRVLGGIHFRNLNLHFPFVGVFAQSRPLKSGEAIPASRRLGEEFRIFRPRSVRWWSGADQFDLRTITGAVGDQRMIVGEIPEILATAPPPVTDYPARTEPETEAEGYERYYDTYQRFIEEHPEWRGNLSLTSRETFKECEDAEALYRLRVGEEYAGLIAASPGRLRGVDGWEVIEEIIAAPFRGKGLGSVMQRLFIERLNIEKGRLIFGTIDDRNITSMKTALRVGRIDVGGWVFLPASSL